MTRAFQRCFTILAAFFVIAFLGRITGDPPQTSYSEIVGNGEIGYLFKSPELETVWVASDEAAMKEMTNAMIAKNREATFQMMLQGRILVCPTGEKVTVVDRGFFLTTVRFMEGKYAGRSGVIENEFIRKQKPASSRPASTTGTERPSIVADSPPASVPPPTPPSAEPAPEPIPEGERVKARLRELQKVIETAKAEAKKKAKAPVDSMEVIAFSGIGNRTQAFVRLLPSRKTMYVKVGQRVANWTIDGIDERLNSIAVTSPTGEHTTITKPTR